ncbi:lytic transglycosylase domain-containing protein [Nocardioides pyridinolyticus]
MRHVRPVRLVLTASVTAAVVVLGLYSRQAPEPAARTGLPTPPTDSIVAAGDPGIPATPDARMAIERALLPAMNGDDDIPAAALAAYQRGASVAAKVDKTCGITWTLLAAVGGIESDHGRHGRSVLGEDGVSTPLIRGVALNGKGKVAEVADTDAGLVDGDEKWDRAVGPMQFLPATWATVGVDADGDGERSADDLDDAALGAAVFLCAVPGTLSERAGLKAALLRYNPSSEYAAEVIALEREYRTGHYALPDLDPAPPSVVQAARQPHTIVSQPARDPQPQPAPEEPQEPQEPGKQGSIGDWPDQHPHSHPPKDPDPTPGPTPGPTPEPQPEPVVEAVTGLLTLGGTEEEPVWSLDETVLDLGDADYLAAPALGDFDGDTIVETNAGELAGLVDTEVTLTVRRTTNVEAPVVLAIGDLDYVVEEPASD